MKTVHTKPEHLATWKAYLRPNLPFVERLVNAGTTKETSIVVTTTGPWTPLPWEES